MGRGEWTQGPEGGRGEKRRIRREEQGRNRAATWRGRDGDEDDGREEEENGGSCAQRTGTEEAPGSGKQ